MPSRRSILSFLTATTVFPSANRRRGWGRRGRIWASFWSGIRSKTRLTSSKWMRTRPMWKCACMMRSRSTMSSFSRRGSMTTTRWISSSTTCLCRGTLGDQITKPSDGLDHPLDWKLTHSTISTTISSSKCWSTSMIWKLVWVPSWGQEMGLMLSQLLLTRAWKAHSWWLALKSIPAASFVMPKLQILSPTISTCQKPSVISRDITSPSKSESGLCTLTMLSLISVIYAGPAGGMLTWRWGMQESTGSPFWTLSWSSLSLRGLCLWFSCELCEETWPSMRSLTRKHKHRWQRSFLGGSLW